MNGRAVCAGAGTLEVGVGIAEFSDRTVCCVERETRPAGYAVAGMAGAVRNIEDHVAFWKGVSVED